MQFTVETIQSKVNTLPNGKGGTYQKCEFTYKNLEAQKVESKILVSFNNPQVFEVAAGASPGQVFVIAQTKGEKYWDWNEMVQQAPNSAGAMQAQSQGNKISVGGSTPKSTYETPEERARKQIYIVKQSSISSAIELLATGAKVPPTVETVLSVAQQFTDFVFGNSNVLLGKIPQDHPSFNEVEVQ